MKEIVLTRDGWHTIAIPEQKVTYHSVHGAIAESKHVFIEAGLNYLLRSLPDEEINVFEMGFGTGLNAFLTAIRATETKSAVRYTTIETLPLSLGETIALNYFQNLGYEEFFRKIHSCNWEEEVSINEYFTLRKIKTDLLHFSTLQQFNLIYYDAFAPSAQPQLWTKEIFEKIYSMLALHGVIVTYCSKGDVRRAMLAAGFSVKTLPGPPGKREMLRAEKLTS
ncbi:MAG: SAM-dependent methyltransferase [Chitinophagaceae bacterium]|nr:MAG: SAM-dependent methyltransferase [Chitinophagaceae bacterium]